MAETPETPAPSLADRIDAAADVACEAWGEPPGSDVPVVEVGGYPATHTLGTGDLRAAAAQLRQLDRIKAAYEAVRHTISVGPSTVCRRPAQGHEGLLCGDKYQDRGETVTVLCTAHWGAWLDGD